jgi:NAD(P)-dependent dehydrogenase (short-subunit alcohol dehydrogenase family)
MGWAASDIPDQSGKVAVVTGANGGLGLEVARELARKGAHVVMAARDQDKAKAARASIRDEIPEASLELQPLDLASLASVHKTAARILANHPRIDILVNNAGVMGIPERRTEDGFEMQLGVNHLGHFALTAELLPALLGSPGARVVSVTGRTGSRNWRTSTSRWNSIGASGRRGGSARSIVVHPGLTNTDLQARSVRETGGGRSQRFYHAVIRVGMTPAQGALSLLRGATDPNAVGGALYTPRWVNWGPPVRRPMFGRARHLDAMARLWEVSERETGMTFDVKPA